MVDPPSLKTPTSHTTSHVHNNNNNNNNNTISNTQATNKSYIVQTLSVGVATYYCMYNIVLVADYCARWLGITYHVEFTVISNRQATFKFNA